MDIVGAYQAKTHLAQLLDRVAKGEKIIITRHGVPVAVLQPVEPEKKTPVCDTIARLKQFQSQNRLQGLSIREMIEEGRK